MINKQVFIEATQIWTFVLVFFKTYFCDKSKWDLKIRKYLYGKLSLRVLSLGLLKYNFIRGSLIW